MTSSVAPPSDPSVRRDPAARAEPADRAPFSIAAFLGALGLALLAAVIDVGYTTDRVRMRLALALVVPLLASGVWRRRHDLLRYARPAAFFAALGLALVVLPFLLRDPEMNRSIGIQNLTYVMLGWGIMLWLPWTAPPRGGEAAWAEPLPEPDRRLWLALAAVLVAAVAVNVIGHVRVIGGARNLTNNESLYILQSRWITQPRHGWAMDTTMASFFMPELSRYANGTVITQYTPGWPAMLAAFRTVGLRDVNGYVLGLVAVLFIYLVGRRVHSERAGLIAATLFVATRWYSQAFQGYMSHNGTLALIPLAAWLLLRAETATRGARVALWVGAGLVLGLCFAMRPLTGAALGVSLALWVWSRGRLTFREVVTMCVLIGAGVALPMAWVLAYNVQTTGKPLLFGYSALHGHLETLGFGERGAMKFDPDMRPAPLTSMFTPVIAARQEALIWWEYAQQIVAGALLLPLLFLGVVYRFRYRWLAVASFLLLEVAQALYFNNIMRYHFELLPFFCVGLGVLVAHLWARSPALGRALVTIAFVAGVSRAWLWRTDWYKPTQFDPWGLARVERAADKHGKILVFVRTPSRSDVFTRLTYFNEEGFDGRILVAIDRGEHNAELMRRLPGRAPVLVVFSGRKGVAPAVIDPMPTQ